MARSKLGVGKFRAFMSPKELKSKAKCFYVYRNNKGVPIITNMFSINQAMKCFDNFKDAYDFWLDEIELYCPNTIIVEVDTSTFYINKTGQNSICYAYRIIKNKEVLVDTACVYGAIPHEYKQIGTYGIAELIGATYALREVNSMHHDNVIIRYDNKFIKSVALGERVDVSQLNSKYVRDYVNEYKKLLKHSDVSFQHVYSHAGDIAHDNIDKKAKTTNRVVQSKILALA